MWGMYGNSPDDQSPRCEEGSEIVALDPDDVVRVGDIISVATRSKKPLFQTSQNYDNIAQLRVLGIAIGDRTLYLCLVTAGDAEHINPTVVVGKGQAFDFRADEFYHGCEGVIVSDLHVRGIAKKQRGRFCDKCTEYNEDVRIPLTDPYLCMTCRENPWR